MLLAFLRLLLLAKDAAMAPSQRDAQRNYQPPSVGRILNLHSLVSQPFKLIVVLITAQSAGAGTVTLRR